MLKNAGMNDSSPRLTWDFDVDHDQTSLVIFFCQWSLRDAGMTCQWLIMILPSWTYFPMFK